MFAMPDPAATTLRSRACLRRQAIWLTVAGILTALVLVGKAAWQYDGPIPLIRSQTDVLRKKCDHVKPGMTEQEVEAVFVGNPCHTTHEEGDRIFPWDEQPLERPFVMHKSYFHPGPTVEGEADCVEVYFDAEGRVILAYVSGPCW